MPGHPDGGPGGRPPWAAHGFWPLYERYGPVGPPEGPRGRVLDSRSINPSGALRPVPKTRRGATDPSSHHGFLDSLDDSRKSGTKRKRGRAEEEDDDSLDLDRIL